jgi:hypothetical protein
MKGRRRMPLRVVLRFAAGAMLGIYGLGRMGDSLFPFRPGSFGLGIGLLAVGAFTLLGLMTARG